MKRSVEPRGSDFCTLAIKAIPNAPRNEIVGWLGEALKIKIHAPPVEGKANDALCEFLADTLGVPRRAVMVMRGDTSRQKIIRIEGLDLAAVKSKLGLERASNFAAAGLKRTSGTPPKVANRLAMCARNMLSSVPGSAFAASMPAGCEAVT